MKQSLEGNVLRLDLGQIINIVIQSHPKFWSHEKSEKESLKIITNNNKNQQLLAN